MSGQPHGQLDPSLPTGQGDGEGGMAEVMDTSGHVTGMQQPEEPNAAATGQGQTGAGHALTRVLRAPGYPSLGNGPHIMKIRHRVPIQLEPDVPLPKYYNPLSVGGVDKNPPYNTSQHFLFSGWLAIPVSSNALYMSDKEIQRRRLRLVGPRIP